MIAPIDFSIAEGKAGAPNRKQHSAPEAKRDPKPELGGNEALITVSYEGHRVPHFAIDVALTFDALESMVLEVTGAEAAYQKVFGSGRLLKRPGDGVAATLEASGVRPGSTVRVVCTSQQAVEEVHERDAGLGKFDGVRGFEEEDGVERRRHEAAPMFAQPASGSVGGHGFARIEPLVCDPLTGEAYTTPP
eukprot:CAMPEP_0173433606 /NCGR_PEP_ID=MMETSP1357-20121228/10994_1 /TAXON_ID=77926 /ORGANISM="Hemiselmis rufescens, Strain PCC563" /LENGTH=190 /DNA_ID=CAMNT_0014398329 /DNA_START=116 /DNA_END=685 /DNA_ORIENTATION=-